MAGGALGEQAEQEEVKQGGNLWQSGKGPGWGHREGAEHGQSLGEGQSRGRARATGRVPVPMSPHPLASRELPVLLVQLYLDVAR